MPGTSLQAEMALPRNIERYFEVALYLMVLTGFATLAQTGQLDPVTVLLVVGALAVRGYFLIRQHAFVLSERTTKYLTLAFAVWYLADFFYISGTFIAATVHLVLALMVVRLFSAHRNRDYVFLAILSFLLVLAASVLTVDSTFLVAFSAFLLAAVATFILLEMRRSAAAATVRARESIEGKSEKRLGWHLAGTSPVLVFFILVGATAIFFVMPRISAGYFSAYAPSGELAAGFSDRVELGQIGEIQQSDSVVMHVQIDGDQRGRYDLKWRGIALSMFDGRNWSSPHRQIVVPRVSDGRFLLPNLSPEMPAQRSALHRSHSIHYRVLLEPLGTNLFFLAHRPEALEGNYRMITTDEGGAVYDLDRGRPPGLYEADSDIAQPTPQELRSAEEKLSAEYWMTYLQLPDLDRRIPDLARQITASASNNYDKAAAIEHYLTANYGYTLQMGRVIPKDPLAYFLFERKQGHCEYFASSMAVMLRTLRIPARVVNGFRTGEFNDVTSQYVVRARNAHSWVEAYFPGYGWVGFDPTPAAGLQTRTGWSRVTLYLDAISSFWREWIINYDVGHQLTLGEQASRTSRGYFEKLRDTGRNHYEALLDAVRKTRKELMRAPGTWSLGAILATLLLLLAINARRIWRSVQTRRVAAHPERAPQKAASIWYGRMIRAVARRGWRKATAQTPAEFMITIADAELREQVEQLTRHYENARFGDSAEDARKLPELYEEMNARR
jgi:transglutaminase-like putative cysteine protease